MIVGIWKGPSPKDLALLVCVKRFSAYTGPRRLAVLHLGDDQRTGCVAGDIDRRPAHIKNPVHACHQRDALHRQTYALQHHSQHYHARTRHASRTDRRQSGGQHDGRHFTHAQVYAVGCGDEYGADALVNGGAVHVDGRAQRKHKRRYLPPGP